jgi:hypothetical protein
MLDRSAPRPFHRFGAHLFVLFLCLGMFGRLPTVSAQGIAAQTAPAHIDLVDGTAFLDRYGDRLPADPGMPVLAGDRITTARGRLSLLLPDGTRVDVDEFADLIVQAPALLRLDAGRLRIALSDMTAPGFRVDTPTGSAHLGRPGEYRVGLMGSASYGQTELAVTRGHAELESDRGSVKLRDRERSVAWPNDFPERPTAFNPTRLDAFEQWAQAQHEAPTGRSAQYLPPDLRMYAGTLDHAGSWGFEGGFGYVWYPQVAPGWRPYVDGYWASVGPYGWTWIGTARWAWPTHHYGRWGQVHDRWFWMPDRRWAPAWVSWGTAPGYVGWSPLGIDNRPLFNLSASVGFGSGWTVLPRERFGARRGYANRYAVAPGRVTTRASLVPAPPASARRPEIRGAAAVRGMERVAPGLPGRPAARPGAANGGAVSTGRPAAGSVVAIGRAGAAPQRDGNRQPSFVPFGDFRRQTPAPGDSGASAAPPTKTPGAPAQSPRASAPPRSSTSPDRAPAAPAQPQNELPPTPSSRVGRPSPRNDASSQRDEGPSQRNGSSQRSDGGGSISAAGASGRAGSAESSRGGRRR